jgi:hypothetical protein
MAVPAAAVHAASYMFLNVGSAWKGRLNSLLLPAAELARANNIAKPSIQV